MPRIKDPKHYESEAASSALEESEIDLDKTLKKRKEEEKAEKEKIKKGPNYTLLYVIFAIIFFFLGILVICLMNLGIHGTFGL